MRGRDNSRIVEPERRLRLVDGDLTRDFGHVAVEGTAHEVVVAEYERLLEVEPARDDISGVLECEFVCLLGFQLVLEQELLVIWQTY